MGLAHPKRGERDMADGFAALLRGRIGKELSFSGYQFERANTEEDRIAAYRFRHRVFLEEGFIDPGDFKDELFTDQFDETSEHILVYSEDRELVGTTRFVCPSKIGFPTEHLFDFDEPDVARDRLGEFGRLAIDSEHRGDKRYPMLGMIKMVYECILERSISHIYAFMPAMLVESYTALGLVSHRLDSRPPTKVILDRRAGMRRYFERNEIQAVLFSLREMEATVGV